MKIDNSISAYYHPGLPKPQVNERPQDPPGQRHETLNAVESARKLAASLSAAEYEKIRSRVEREQGSRVVPDGLNRYARNALTTYDSIGRNEDRDEQSQLLGVDVFA